jgi:acetyl esterase
MAEGITMSALDQQSQAVVDGLNASGLLPFRQFNPAELRAKALSLRAASPASPALEVAKVSEETITTPNGAFTVRILHPRIPATGEKLPVVIYFHGGGFIFGGLDQVDDLTRKMAKRAQAVVVNVDYRLSPEAKFPLAVNDAYATLEWVAANAARLGIDPGKIVISGDSAGGNLTIVTCLTAREREGPSIRFQVPIYPSLDLRSRPTYASRLKWGGGKYILDNEDIEWLLEQYLNSREEGDDWRASPILAQSFSGLPSALVVTADHDPLMDEGKLYADRLKADGVDTEYACFEGTFHGFVGYADLIDVGARGVDLICDRIKRAVAR